MARPVTLFTGQWADLPFEEVARLAGEWGYDGLEIACWGDHFDPWAAVEDDAYVRGRRDILEKHGLQVFAISNHLTGQAVCDDPIDERHRGILPARVWGDGEPEGVRRRAAEAMQVTARAAARARRAHGRRVHRVEDLEDGGDVPAGARVDDRRRVPRLRRPLEPDPRRVRRGGRAVRPRGAPQRDRLRLLDGRARAGGGRAPGGVRAELGPEPLRLAGPRPRRVPLGLPGPDLPRRLQGREAPGRQRPQRSSRVAPARGRTRGGAGTSSRPGTATSRGRRASGCSTRSATTARSRSSGRTPAWTGWSARRRRWRSCAGLAFDPPAAAFDAAFSSS